MLRIVNFLNKTLKFLLKMPIYMSQGINKTKKNEQLGKAKRDGKNGIKCIGIYGI